MSQLQKFLRKIESHNNKYVYFENTKFTYSEIIDKSYALARVIEQHNRKKIFFNLKNSPLSICLYLASLIADVDFSIPINPRLVDSELVSILEPDSIFFTFQKSVFLDDFANKNNIKIIKIFDEVGSLKALKKPQDFRIYNKCQIAHVSSGTTGFYQKHYHSIDQIINYATTQTYRLGLMKEDHLLIVLSVNHAYAFSYQLLPALELGLNITFVKEFTPQGVLKIINNSKVSALALLPSMYYLLELDKININSLRYVSVAGDMISEDLQERISNKLQLPLLTGIGMTEVFGYGQNTVLEEVNIIEVFPDTNIKIEKFDGVDYGKIFIKNEMLPLGSCQDWFETGDVGSFNERAYKLKFYGRYKDIIIKGGSNIAPKEIENIILKIDGINDCVVVGKTDKIWGEVLCGFLVTDKIESTLDFINDHLVNYLAKYKKIDHIVKVDKIPLTPTGKINRKHLKEIANEL